MNQGNSAILESNRHKLKPLIYCLYILMLPIITTCGSASSQEWISAEQEPLNSKVVSETASPTPEPTSTVHILPTPAQRFSLTQMNEDGFGNPMNQNSGALEVFNGMLYVGTRNPEDGAEIWRYDGSTWDQAVSNGFGVGIEMIDDLIEYQGAIYAGTWSMRTLGEGIGSVEKGGEVWRSSNGETWEQVVENGFGLGPIQAEVMRFFKYDDYLYASTLSWDGDPAANGGTLWRTSTGNIGDWIVITSNGFDEPDNKGVNTDAMHTNSIYIGTGGTTLQGWGARIFVSQDGLNWEHVPDIEDKWEGWNISAMEAYKGALYAAVILQEPDPTEKYANDFFGRPRTGKIYRCILCDGSDWELSFDGPYINPGAWRKMALFEYSDTLFMTIGNDDYGMEIWYSFDGESWENLANRGIDDQNNARLFFDNGYAIYEDVLYFGISNHETGTEIWSINLEE